MTNKAYRITLSIEGFGDLEWPACCTVVTPENTAEMVAHHIRDLGKAVMLASGWGPKTVEEVWED